jgi:hypothetical protein
MKYNPFDSKKKFPVCDRCWNEFPDTRGFPCIINKLSMENIKITKLPDFCQNEDCSNFNKLKPKKKEQFYNCNISPRSSKLLVTKENINLIAEWAQDWFCNERYQKYFWWIESGKLESDQNLHLHFIWKKGKYLNTRNHKRDMSASWNLIPFDGNRGKIKNKDDNYSKGFTGEMLGDKIIYALNSSKDTHENYRDLLNEPPEGTLRAWGGCNSLTAKFEELRRISVIDSILEKIEIVE